MDARDLETAIAMASYAHSEQRRKSGDPYILHPLRVMQRVKGYRAMVLAVLHDTVEDTFINLDDILFHFGEDIMRGIALLTHIKGEPYAEYIQAILDSGDADVIAVKIADIDDNTRAFAGYMMPEGYIKNRRGYLGPLRRRLLEVENG